ncbi:AraC-like DNA-binding protein [Pseudoduganella lurida]|uniref:AraC-like DNA-binding protein n=1 Tax=Pseudoduganella lurida TaxID=1036180 RepID=A0A562RLJ6_9BURK|nr:helix-turn-helix transcriptional regulator [Pseudoduganella lurida]TWI69310.1 AraC-like DNA-binding protein [Pseudoduganella lurida]
MPIFGDTTNIDWEDPDLVARPVITVGAIDVDANVVDGSAAPSPGHIQQGVASQFHQHRKGQFLLWLRGVLTCEVAGGFWLVPPGGAIWVPGGVPHRMETSGTVACYVVYVDSAACEAMPHQCCTLSVTPLLRELVIRSAAFPMHYDQGAMPSRIMALLLEEVALAQPGGVHLPMPADRRLRKLIDGIMAAPAAPTSIAAWAQRLDISPRTLSRLVTRETGMSFGRWRRQLQLLIALQWMAKGAKVQDVAEGLGYDNASNFVLMFRKALGQTPARYLATRSRGTSDD